MPLSRFLIKNEYGLADPELYRAADKDDPEALLEGVAMAGLVGLLRQLGDLAEFAAEIFHDLHEEVMATAARGHGLLVRVQQLEAEFPSIETTLLSQTSHSSLLDNTGSEWHPNLRMEQNLITQGDLPRFVMVSYEECRGPPRLFILDKFDVAGAGACLKRYTDPTYFKVDGPEYPESHREKKRKAKVLERRGNFEEIRTIYILIAYVCSKNDKKESQVKNGDNTPQALPKVHTRLHDLLHKETVENIINGPASRVKLKRRLNENKLEQSYMEKFLKINSEELEVVREISVISAPLLLCNRSPGEELSPKRSSYSSSSDIDDSLAKPPIDQLTEEAKYELSGVKRQFSSETYETFSPLHNDVDEKEIEVDRERKMGSTTGYYQSDEIASDVENYMDALATIDSDIEVDMQCRSKNDIYSSKQQPDIDANQSDLPDSQPVESFILTDDESISSSGELSELSYSDNSNLTKAVPSDDSVSAIECSDLSRLDDDHLLSEQPLIDQNYTTHHLDNICNDVSDVEADISTYSCGIGEEQSSSCHSDTRTVSLSLDLQGSLKEDPSENSESNDEGSTNNENRECPPDDLRHASKISDSPSEAVQTLLSVSSAENHLEYQDQVDTSTVLRKILESENNKDVNFTESSTNGEPHTSYTETVAFKVPNFVDTVATEPVTYSLGHMDPSQLTVFRVDEQPESFVALGERQPEFSALFDEEHTGLVVRHSEEPQMMVSHEQDQFDVSHADEHSQLLLLHTEEQDQFTVSHADEHSQLLLLHTEEHNQLVSHEEEQTPLVVSNIERKLAEEQPRWPLSRAEVHPQLSPSQAAEQPQLTSSDKEEQLRLITSHTEERPLSIASCVELQSQPLALTDPCSVVLREHDSIVIPEVVVSSKSSSSIHCLTTNSMEQNFSEGTEIISPVELRLPIMDNLKGHVSEADCGENNFFIDRTASVQHEFHSDTLNSEEVSNEYVPLVDEGTETKLSKATSEVSAACLMDDIYLIEDQDLSVVEELTSIVRPLHSVIEMEHSLGPLDRALLEERSQKTGTETGLETVLCNTVSNMESNTGLPVDINEIMKTSEIINLEQSVLDSDIPLARNSRMETPHKVLQIVEQFEKELKPAEKVSPKAYFHKKQSATPDCLYLEEQPNGSPKFAEVPMSEFSKPNHFAYVESQPVGQSIPMSTFPVKAIQSPNFLNQEDHFIASGPSVRSLSFLPPSNARNEDRVPSIAIFPSFDLPGQSQNMFDEMPPLPPLPPVQWRMPKALLQHAPEALERNLEQFDVTPLTMSQSTDNLSPQLDHEIREVESTGMQFSTLSAIKDEVSNHECNLSPISAVVSNEQPEDFHIPDRAQSSMAPPITDDDDRLGLPHNEEDGSLSNGSKTLQDTFIETLDGLAPENEKSLALIVTTAEVDPRETALASTNMDDGKPRTVSSNSEDHSMFAPHLETAYVKSNGGFQKKLPRPRNPLIDAVVALDKTKLRKVTERIRPPSVQKVDERDTFLEQIRTKSFNLKPTAVTRPSIRGPKTNLNVAAILEKANSIRQAFAGSDDDDDDNDSWSDS